MKTELYPRGLKKGVRNILAKTIEMDKFFLINRRLKGFEVGNTKIHGVNMATMALTKRGT